MACAHTPGMRILAAFLSGLVLSTAASADPDLQVLAPYEGFWLSGDGARALHLDLSDDVQSVTLQYARWTGDAWHWAPAWQVETSSHGGWPQGWQSGETRNDPPLVLHDDTDPGIEWHRDTGLYGRGYIVEIDIWDVPQDGRFTWQRLHSRRNGLDRMGAGVWIAVPELH